MILMHLMPRRYSGAHQRRSGLVRALGAVLTLALIWGQTPAATASEIPEDLRIDFSSIVVSKDELVCLAMNDYWEARSEVIAGRIAVARVVLNRAMDPRYPNNICDVVKQSRNGQMHKCQFSWYCDGKADAPYDPNVWRDSLKIAAAVLQKDSSMTDPTDGALWYHADFIRPSWAMGYESTTIIGTHVFYREPLDLDDAPRRKPFVERLNAFADFVATRKTGGTRTVASR